MDKLLEVRNLKTYFHTQDGVVKAVDGVSYDVNKGETIALVGESGCGKTVSALSILRLVAEPAGKIEAGEILFDGIDLLKLTTEEMRKMRGAKISIIFQEPLTSLNPVLTIGRQISEGLEFHRNISLNEGLKEAVRLLQLVGIPHPERRIYDYPHQFSGGMRQRAMIAIAIACQPQLIIADEPTTVVDVTIQAQLLELIRNITKELNTALILITHNLGIVARYAHRVFVMYAGNIVERGSAMDVYHYPCHPYTAGLLTSVPRLDEPRKIRLIPIDGQPPDLIAPPIGCAFQSRCNYSIPKCQNEKPPLQEVAPNHYAACWVSQKDQRPWQKKSL
ncbi:MAG: ABC transporter ATP-binding protein [Dehalococcoidales bacterium]|nr:ABC transporter ATP-binding protein [Dehalococcoidales bacterium]